ncbi:hypothetical protein GYMLUDRAFT_115590, partial [Collybiopsis luxurians FD-317 M1]
LPKFLWPEAINHSVWIRNCTPSINGKNLIAWGATVTVRDLNSDKLDPRGQDGKFVGYDAESKGIRVYWPNRRIVSVERDDRHDPSDIIFATSGSEGEHKDISSPVNKDLPSVPSVPSSTPSSITHIQPEPEPTHSTCQRPPP